MQVFDKTKVRIELTELDGINSDTPRKVYVVYYNDIVLGMRASLATAKKLGRLA